MRTPVLATTAWLALLAAPAGAGQFDYGGRTGFAWGSNVFGTADNAEIGGKKENPQSDYSMRISPFVGLSDPDGNFTWQLRYQPTYEHYLHQTDLDGFDQDVSAGIGWRFADRWTLSVNEQFALYQSPVRFNESTGNPANPVILRVQNSEIRSNATGAVLSYGIDARNSLALITNYHFTTYSQGTGNDHYSPATALAYQHVLSERTTIGTRFSWIQQTVTRQSGQNDKSTFYNLAGTVEHAFSPTLRLEASAGPTFITSSPAEQFAPLQFGIRSIAGEISGQKVTVPFAVDAESCKPPNAVLGRVASFGFTNCDPVAPLSQDEVKTLSKLTKTVPTVDEQGHSLQSGGSGSTDFTYFARLALIKDWETWHGELAYERANSNTATFASSTVADSVEGSLRWNPIQLWTFNLIGAVSLQDNSTENVVPKEFVVVNAPPPPGLSSIPSGAQIAQVQKVVGSLENNAEKYLTESVAFSVTRQLTPHSSAFAALYWYGQRQDLNFPSEQVTRWKNLTLWIGLDWQFDPIRF